MTPSPIFDPNDNLNSQKERNIEDEKTGTDL